MTKQEDIIEELAVVLCHIDGLYWNDLTLTEASDYKKKTELVCIKVDRELPVVCELEPDVDACFGQEVCCEILPKYIQGTGSVSSGCYREVIGLAYKLADTIAKTQRDFNAKAGIVAVAPLIEEEICD